MSESNTDDDKNAVVCPKAEMVWFFLVIKAKEIGIVKEVISGDVSSVSLFFYMRGWWWECWYVCPSAEMGSTWTGLLGLEGRWEPESSEQQEPPAETRTRDSRPTARRTILLSPSYPVTADLVVTTFVTPFPPFVTLFLRFVTLFLRFVTRFQGFVMQIQQSQLLQIWWCFLSSPPCVLVFFILW